MKNLQKCRGSRNLPESHERPRTLPSRRNFPTAAEAQSLDVLARKRREVPPARPEVSLSAQGRPGALRSLCRARHPSDTMHWLVSEGEYKDVLINSRRPHCRLPMDRRPARGYNARAAPRRDIQGLSRESVRRRLLLCDKMRLWDKGSFCFEQKCEARPIAAGSVFFLR